MSAFGIATSARHYVSARLHARLGGDALLRYQDARARRVIASAIERSPFYRHHLAGLCLDQWREFPTIDKATMMANFDEFTTTGVSGAAAMSVGLNAELCHDHRLTLGELTVGLSSGTSGHRGLFILDPWERAVWAGRLLAWVLPGLRLRGYKATLFLRSGSNLYDTVRTRWVELRYHDLMLPLAEAVDQLNAFRPDILVAPPSLLAMLAAQRTAGRLRAAPSKVISVAEVLDPTDEACISEAFGSLVHQLYQCTEGLLAATCREGVLHVLEDCVALQYKAAAGADGARVLPIITDLWRRTQPIIRYRLNDILVLETSSCRCGSAFQRIARIEGRQDDVFYFDLVQAASVLSFRTSCGGSCCWRPRTSRTTRLCRTRSAQSGFTSRAMRAPPTTPLRERCAPALTVPLCSTGCTIRRMETVPSLLARCPNAKRRRVRKETP